MFVRYTATMHLIPSTQSRLHADALSDTSGACAWADNRDFTVNVRYCGYVPTRKRTLVISVFSNKKNNNNEHNLRQYSHLNGNLHCCFINTAANLLRAHVSWISTKEPQRERERERVRSATNTLSAVRRLAFVRPRGRGRQNNNRYNIGIAK